MQKWTVSNVKKASTILSKHTAADLDLALEKISKKLGFTVTRSSLRHGFNGHNVRFQDFLVPMDDDGVSEEGSTEEETWKEDGEDQDTSPTDPDSFDTLVKMTRRGPISLIDICNKLECSPKIAEGLIRKARAAGLLIHLENNHVGRTAEDKPRIIPITTLPDREGRYKVAVISDTHLGSKYCLRAELREFILKAYAEGVRDILHPGDVLDGDYRHGKFEMSHMGVEEQTRDLFETLPKLPGLNYHCITGNHDWTFTEGSGMDVGNYISALFAKWGRHDVHFYGNRSAFLNVGGAKIHLWHPKKGAGYARSYGVQKQIENYASWEKPHVLLTGHWHIFCHVFERGVHGIACPTFQGGGSAFSKSLGGSPAIGGMILDWTMTKEGEMRGFRLEKVTYTETGGYTGLNKE